MVDGLQVCRESGEPRPDIQTQRLFLNMCSCEMSSFAAQVLPRYTSLHFTKNGYSWHTHITDDKSVGNLCKQLNTKEFKQEAESC